MYVRLFRAHGTDRVAFVSTLPSSSGAGKMVQVARGPKRKSVVPKLFGPLEDAQAEEVFQRELDALLAEGFVYSGLGVLLSALDSKKRRKRTLAALRLGWMRQKAAVEPLLELAKKANEELPTLVDTLGELGDARAIVVARAAAERKLLSRRRSGVEALWKLGDAEGLADARNRALERLPPSVREALQNADVSTESAAAVAALHAVVAAVPVKDRGLAIDTLYELRTPLTVSAVRSLVKTEAIEKPHLWRYAKSVLKRSMSRFDFVTFGLLAHRIEALRKTAKGTVATLKSGLDGETKQMRVFGKKTQLYVIRSLWRYLVRLARYRPLWYAHAASEVLVHYRAEDERKPSGLSGRYASLYLFSKIVFGASTRFQVDHRRLKMLFKSSKHAAPPAGAREEACPEQWDAAPEAYVRVLAGATLPLVHEMGLRAVRANPKLLENASNASVVAMVGAPYEATVELAVGELRRRFDPASPDVELLRLLVADARQKVRAVGLEWLEASRDVWVRDAALVMELLSSEDPAARSAVAEHAVFALDGAGADARRSIAKAIYRWLLGKEPIEGAHDAHGRIGQVLSVEIAELARIDELVALLAHGSPAARNVAVGALARKPDAATLLGTARLVMLASDENGGVRAAAQAMLEAMLPELTKDPSPLFSLLEVPFEDARRFAKEMLSKRIDLGVLSFDALLGLADSNLKEAQDLGKELILARLEALPADKLIAALTQHPHRNIQRFALDLVVRRLQQGFVRLTALEEFFRGILLDANPDRAMKRTLIDFLGQRGLADEHQAAVAAKLLAEVAKSRTRYESERAIVAVAKIKVAFPHVDAPGFELEVPA